jgi:hypothetical protein
LIERSSEKAQNERKARKVTARNEQDENGILVMF